MTLADYRNARGEPPAPEGEVHVAEHHPSAVEYLQIGFILAVITALEVGLYYLDISRGLLVTSLAIASMAKFSLVVLWFMHLKFDSRIFGYLFILGLGGTAVLFSIVLATEAANVV